MKLAKIELKGNEHGRLRRDTIYAVLLDDKGYIEISATLEYVLTAIRDRKLNVEGVSVSHDKKGNSIVSLDPYRIALTINDLKVLSAVEEVIEEITELKYLEQRIQNFRKGARFTPDWRLSNALENIELSTRYLESQGMAQAGRIDKERNDS